MPRNPLVSVVIPTYNNGELAVNAVESALAQTYSPFEVIVIDDGSEDDTAEKMAAFGDKIRLLKRNHVGAGATRNAGIRTGRGSVIAFLDSDDIWKPDKLGKSVPPLLKDKKIGVVYTDFEVIDLETGIRQYTPCYRKSGDLHRQIFMECRGVSTSTIVTRRDCLRNVGLFDDSLVRCQDWELFIRLAEEYEYYFVPEVLTVRRLHGGGLSVESKHLYRKYNLRVIDMSARRRPDLYENYTRRAKARAYVRFGLMHYENFEMKEARRDLGISLALRFNLKALNYLLRTYLPKSLIAWIRNKKIARQQTGHKGTTAR